MKRLVVLLGFSIVLGVNASAQNPTPDQWRSFLAGRWERTMTTMTEVGEYEYDTIGIPTGQAYENDEEFYYDFRVDGSGMVGDRMMLWSINSVDPVILRLTPQDGISTPHAVHVVDRNEIALTLVTRVNGLDFHALFILRRVDRLDE